MSPQSRKVLKLLQPWAIWVPLVAITTLAVNILETAIPVQLRTLVNSTFSGGPSVGIPWWRFVALAALLAVSQLLRIAQRLAAERPATRISATLFQFGVLHLLSNPLSWFARNHSGAIQVRLERSSRAISDMLKAAVTDIISPLTGVCMATFLMCRADVGAGLIVVLAAPLLVLLTVWQARNQAGVRFSINRGREAQGVRVSEAVLGIEQVKLFRAELGEAERAGSVARSLAEQEFSHHVTMARFDLAKFWVEKLAFGLVLAYAITAAMRPGSTLGAGGVLMLVLLYERVAETLRHLHRIMDETHEKWLLAKDYLLIMDADLPVRLLSCTKAATGPELICENVSFKYADASTRVLKDVSFRSKAGSKVALVGRSGSGKTTLAKLLIGLCAPDKGHVLVGGHEVKRIEEEGNEVPLTGMLSQDVYIFAGTIAENIRFGRPEATDSDMRKAAAVAGLADYIETLPNKYDTPLGQRGQGLSGGQKQRLALARVILQDPDVMIFDEPSASLDAESARQFFRQVLKLFKSKTVIVITHDLSDLSWADQVVLLDKGRIQESGTHADLVSYSSALQILRDGIPDNAASPAAA